MLKDSIRYTLFALIVLLTGCIWDDMPLCPVGGIKLKYYYILNPYSSDMENVNLFGSDIDRMNILVFNEDRILVQDTLISNPWELLDDNEIYLPLPPGKYTIVSWGGSSTLGSRHDSYEMIEAINPSDPSSFIPYLTKGVSTLDDYRLILKDDHPEDLSHVKSINTTANLYYGAYKTMESKPDAITGATVSITKNTNTIYVKIGGISHLSSPNISTKIKTKASADAPIDVFITARNGRYKYNNSIEEYARTVRYEQPHQMIHPDTMLVNFTVLRLMEDDKTSRVVLENSVFPSGQLSLDIVSAIIKADERINNQNDLDKHDVYNIGINLDKSLTATIWINGWLYNTIYPG